VGAPSAAAGSAIAAAPAICDNDSPSAVAGAIGTGGMSLKMLSDAYASPRSGGMLSGEAKPATSVAATAAASASSPATTVSDQENASEGAIGS
jgi:hypothetical protein